MDVKVLLRTYYTYRDTYRRRMDGSQPYNPRTVEEVFRDFKSRRASILKALTTVVEEFYQWLTCYAHLATTQVGAVHQNLRRIT